MILEIDSVELSFDEKKILYGIYLKIETGKVTGVLGRNGCGKTSLLRILFGDLNPKYKNVRVDGKHLKSAQRGPSKNKTADNCSSNELHAYPAELCQDIYEYINEFYN